jgi:hypothetical protein
MSILLVGCGNLGGVLLDLLAREAGVARLVAADREEARVRQRARLAHLSALTLGRAPVIESEPLDVMDEGAVAALVRRARPDIVITSVTFQTWWLASLLPPREAAVLDEARFGAWLPVHLAPTMALMRALREADYQGLTLTAPYPDVVNCVLGRVGLAPTCGIGNLDELEPKVRVLAAGRLHVDPDEVAVTLVAHHAFERYVYAGAAGEPPPHVVRVGCGGRDVTDEVRARELLVAPWTLPPTPAWHGLTGASTVRLVRALASETPARLHAPGPGGLPGGYPVFASREGVRVAPIEGLSQDEAIRINERSHAWDGIDRIEADGTVAFSQRDTDVLRRALGYDGARLSPSDAAPRARELAARFREYARKAGVDLDRARGFWSA